MTSLLSERFGAEITKLFYIQYRKYNYIKQKSIKTYKVRGGVEYLGCYIQIKTEFSSEFGKAKAKKGNRFTLRGTIV